MDSQLINKGTICKEARDTFLFISKDYRISSFLYPELPIASLRTVTYFGYN